MTYADTDGLLDRCHCGAVAGFESDSPSPLRVVQWRARCTECCEQTAYYIERNTTVLIWNIGQRNMRGAQ